MASPKNLGQLRYKTAGSLSSTFTAASAAGWNTSNAVKIRVHNFEAAVKFEGAEDPTLEGYLWHRRARIPTIRDGSFKFSCFIEGATVGAATTNPVATLLSTVFGSVQAAPAALRPGTLTSGSTTTVLEFTGAHSSNAGQAVLVGTRGDGGGNGVVRIDAGTGDSNSLNLLMALPGSPASGAAVIGATSVYLRDNANPSYNDFLYLGDEVVDQIQAIGCNGPVKLTQLNPGEVPMLEFEQFVSDWQEVPSADRISAANLEINVASSGNQPAMGRGLGGCFLADFGSTTVTNLKIGALSIDPGLSFVAIPDPNGNNGKGGWVKMPNSPPTFEFTALIDGTADPLPGLYDDFAAGTAKQIIFQFGHAAGACAAVDMPRCFIDAAPVRADINGLAGVKIVGHAAANQLNDGSGASNELQYAAMRVHFM